MDICILNRSNSRVKDPGILDDNKQQQRQQQQQQKTLKNQVSNIENSVSIQSEKNTEYFGLNGKQFISILSSDNVQHSRLMIIQPINNNPNGFNSKY